MDPRRTAASAGHRMTQPFIRPYRRATLVGRLSAPWWRLRFGSFGARSVLRRPFWLEGAKKIAIGAGVFIHAGCWLAAEEPAWQQPGPALVIGDGCTIGARACLSANESIVLERNVTLAMGALVIDSDHSWEDGFPRIVENISRSAPVRVGRGTWIGQNATVLRGSSIGAYCVVAANSVVKGEFPDFSIIGGAPGRIIGSTVDLIDPALRTRIDAGTD